MQFDARERLIQPNASIATAVHSPIVSSFAIACMPRSRNCCAGFQRRKNCSFGPFRAYMPSCRRYPNFPLFIFSFPPFSPLVSFPYFPPPCRRFFPISSLPLLLPFTSRLLLPLPFHLSSLRVLPLSHPVLAVALWLARCDRTKVRISPWTAEFIANATVICSLGHGLRTFAVVLRSNLSCIPAGSLNRVPALAGVKAKMSPLSGGR